MQHWNLQDGQEAESMTVSEHAGCTVQATNKTEGQQQGQSCLLDLLVTLEVQTLDVLA